MRTSAMRDIRTESLPDRHLRARAALARNVRASGEHALICAAVASFFNTQSRLDPLEG